MTVISCYANCTYNDGHFCIMDAINVTEKLICEDFDDKGDSDDSDDSDKIEGTEIDHETS